MTPRSQLRTEMETDVSKDPIKAADRFFSAHVGINKMLVVDREDRSPGSRHRFGCRTDYRARTKSRRKPARDS